MSLQAPENAHQQNAAFRHRALHPRTSSRREGMRVAPGGTRGKHFQKISSPVGATRLHRKRSRSLGHKALYQDMASATPKSPPKNKRRQIGVGFTHPDLPNQPPISLNPPSSPAPQKPRGLAPPHLNCSRALRVSPMRGWPRRSRISSAAVSL